jgi:hypothetical protein
MHSPYYKDEGQIDDNLTVKSTLLFGLVEKGHIQFYVNKLKEAEGVADGVSLVAYADGKEIVRVKENPYLHAEPRHTVTLDFDIPAGTKLFTIKIEANGNIAYDHTYIEKLDVRKPRVIGWIAFSACVIIILFLLLGSEIKDVKERYPEIKVQVKELISKGHWRDFIREPVFYIVLISILARIVYFYDWIPFWMAWDTIYYIKEPIINSYRVPFYPIFSRLVHFGDEFMWYRTMVNIQSLCGIIAAGCFYRVAEWLIKNKRIAFFCAVFYSCLPYIVVVYERGLLSESFAISFTVFLIYCVTRYLQNPNKISAMMIGVWSIMLTMLKELYIPIIIPLFLLFWIIRLFLETDGAPVKAGFKWIFICWGIVLFHAYLFNAKIGVFANSLISTNYNLSYNLVQYDLYQNPIDPEINDEITRKEKPKFRFDVWPYMDSLHTKFGVKRMTRYWKDALRRNFGGFIKYSIDELKKTRDMSVIENRSFDYIRGYIKENINSFIKTYSEVPEEEWKKLDVRYKEKTNGEFFAPLFFPDIKLWHIWALIFIEAIIILHSLVHRKRILYLEIIISGITVAIFLAAIIMAWGYDQRLSSPALPFVILLVFLNLSRLFDSKKYESTTPHL